jgi:hypothetical protein
MLHIDGPSKSKRLNFYAAYETIGGGVYGKIFLCLGFQVKAHMIVIGTQLTEIAAKQHGYAEGIAKISLGVGSRNLGTCNLETTEQHQ